MAVPDGIFFDEKAMLAMGWPFGVVQMLRRVFESDAVNLQTEIDANSDSIATNASDISTNSTDISTNSSDITSLQDDKADKISSPTTGNLISQDAGGNIQDAGVNASDLVTLSGTGNPEGLTTSNNSRFFVDTVAPQLYFNPTIGSNTGWVAL